MDKTRSAPETTLYDEDFYSWTQQQAEHIHHGRLSCLDLENIAEEIDSLGKSQLSALTSSYRLIAMHLLKMMQQPRKKTSSWTKTIDRERGTIELLLIDNPGLKPKRAAAFARAYAVARRDAASKTGLSENAFRWKRLSALRRWKRATSVCSILPRKRKRRGIRPYSAARVRPCVSNCNFASRA